MRSKMGDEICPESRPMNLAGRPHVERECCIFSYDHNVCTSQLWPQFIRQGTLPDQAIIVCSIYNSHLDTNNQNYLGKKHLFRGFVFKTAELHFAWFCNLLQTSWAVEKAQRFIPLGSRFCANIFIFVIYFSADNLHLTDHFLLSKKSLSKYMTTIKIPSAQKPGACGNPYYCFFYCPRGLQ